MYFKAGSKMGVAINLLEGQSLFLGDGTAQKIRDA